MGQTTGIEWTDATWSPIRGCSMVSAGCAHCYAQTMAHRFSGPGQPYEGLVQLGADGKSMGKWNGVVRFVEERLLDPLRWKEPRRIFVNSMSDLFHENVTDAMLDRIFAVMALCPQHSLQVLTKRPERMRGYLSGSPWGKIEEAAFEIASAFHKSSCAASYGEIDIARIPLPNVWLGVSVEDQKTANKRIPLLLQTPAAVRFVSAEPLLGAVNLRKLDLGSSCWRDATSGEFSSWGPGGLIRKPGQAKLDWVIVGGESGPGARPMHPDWARSLRDQCKAAGVPFFFKQWGEWLPHTGGMTQLEQLPSTTPVTYLSGDGHHGQSIAEMDGHGKFGRMLRVGKKAAGHLLDGVAHREFPATESKEASHE